MFPAIGFGQPHTARPPDRDTLWSTDLFDWEVGCFCRRRTPGRFRNVYQRHLGQWWRATWAGWLLSLACRKSTYISIADSAAVKFVDRYVRDPDFWVNVLRLAVFLVEILWRWWCTWVRHSYAVASKLVDIYQLDPSQLENALYSFLAGDLSIACSTLGSDPELCRLAKLDQSRH
jgi:hypothetical protein